MRVQSSSHVIGGPSDESGRPKNRSRRVVSESVESAPMRRKLNSISTRSSQSKGSSSRVINGIVADTPQKQERRSAMPDNSDDRDLSSPELPHEPMTPISLGKNEAKAPFASAIGSGFGVLEPRSPEVAKWAKGESRKGKGKEKAVEGKKTRFAQDPVGDESEDEKAMGGWQDEEREKELSLQVSPRRPTAPPIWLQSPHRKSAANINMNTTAQDFLRNIVHDVMYDFQRDTKAEMMGLHLDLVRMGRGWKQELRDIMAEWSEEIQELKLENRRLREENERLRRGY
jgi:protein NEDD1